MLNVSDYTAHLRCLVSCSYWTIQSHNLSLKVVFHSRILTVCPTHKTFLFKNLFNAYWRQKKLYKKLIICNKLYSSNPCIVTVWYFKLWLFDLKVKEWQIKDLFRKSKKRTIFLSAFEDLILITFDPTL